MVTSRIMPTAMFLPSPRADQSVRDSLGRALRCYTYVMGTALCTTLPYREFKAPCRAVRMLVLDAVD